MSAVPATKQSVILRGVNTDTLGGRLSQVLHEQGLSQSELARRVGVKPQSIQHLCQKKTKRSAYVAEIAEALNVCPFWLATGIGEKAPWQALDAEARLVATVYDTLPPHAQRQLQEYLRYLRQRFAAPSKNHISLADC